MKTLTYNSANLSTKERLTISNLLSLFDGRLNAKWISVNPGERQHPDVVFVDIDLPEGRLALEASPTGATILPVTADDRSQYSPSISRPIRAYGPNGLIVLFNAFVDSSDSGAKKEQSESREGSAGYRIAGRLEVLPAPVKAVRPSPTPAPSPAPVQTPRTIPEAPPPATGRVSVQWGPPQPIHFPPLTHMPGARVHRFGKAGQRPEALDLLPSSPPTGSIPLAPGAPDSKTHQGSAASTPWRAPEAVVDAPLVSMPISHRPVEHHRPPSAIIGRGRVESTVKRLPENDPTIPVLRPSPPQWKEVAPQALPEDAANFQSIPDPANEIAPSSSSPDLPEIAPAEELPSIAAAEFVIDPPSLPVAEEIPADSPFEVAEVEFSGANEGLGNLSNAVAIESLAEDSADDADAGWWEDSQFELDNAEGFQVQNVEGSLLGALKAIMASNQPSILEIAGLPAVCVIPSRRIYFTTAPAARLESAIGPQTELTWRTCSSEAEARQMSGTEQSRQASLEQLCWTASLLSGAANAGSAPDQAVRLRRWPPLTESRTRSKFVRYATLLSGAHATPREIAEITGDSLEEIATFVHACAEMNLLEASGQSIAPQSVAPKRTQGISILRSMIEQLAPSKI